MRYLFISVCLVILSACGQNSGAPTAPTSPPKQPIGQTPERPDVDSKDFDYLENADGDGSNVLIGDPVKLDTFYGPRSFFGFFQVHIVINKATQGPEAQTLKVYIPAQSEDPIYTFAVSTGREKYEKAPSGRRYWTTTPTGMFIIERLAARYYSKLWAGSPMPYAMFLNSPNERNRPTGFAIHGIAKSKEIHLGERASGGCVRLATANAKILFELVRDNYRGKIPVFYLSQMQQGLFINMPDANDFEDGYTALIRIINDEDAGRLPSVQTVQQ